MQHAHAGTHAGAHGHSRAGTHSHSGPWSESLPARLKADLADSEGSIDLADQIWSQWRSAALIAQGPARIARFVQETVGPVAADVLEVGCGSGYLALALARAGHRTVGVDPSPEGIDLGNRTLELCRKAGEAIAVEYHEAEFGVWNDGGRQFDALVFNLSLHHIEDLDGALAKAERLLRPGGRIVINDYVFDRLDERTIAWLADMETTLGLVGGQTGTLDPAAARESIAGNIAEAATTHVLHHFAPLIAGLRRTFEEKHFSWEPFLYTRIANRAPGLDRERQDRLVPYLAALERLLIEQGAIQSVCYRFVGTRK